MKKIINTITLIALCLSTINAQTTQEKLLGFKEISAQQTFFQEPVSDFITSPDEKSESIIFGDGDVKDLQAQIDDFKASNPQSLLTVHIQGTVNVKKMPLVLGSKTFLSFEGLGQMKAVSKAGTEALIHIKDAEFVSITSVESTALSMLDGAGFAKTGILVSKSGKVNIDNVNIIGCTEYGIDYLGRDASLLNEAGSVTRCKVIGATKCGIRAKRSTRFVLLDNKVSGAEYGIHVIAKSATVVGNHCTFNKTGLFVGEAVDIDGPGSMVGRNFLSQNTVGLELASSTITNIVTENQIFNNETGLVAGGFRNHIYNNTLTYNKKALNVTGKENIIAQHNGVEAKEAKGGESTKFFNPPTLKNPHQDHVIVQGMGRQDMTFTQEKDQEAIDLATVQIALDKKRKQFPNDVIVLWLKGNFVAKGEYTGLDLPKHTCVVLDGIIYPEGDGMDKRSAEDHYAKLDSTGGTQLVLMKHKGYNSFSGGVLDCKDMCSYGIYAPGNSVGIIEDVYIKEAFANNIGVLHHSGNATPMFISNCRFNGFGTTNRAIWLHMCNYVHCISNVSENHFADYADIDAHAHYTSVLFSTSKNERRTGIFIEEKASNNFCVANTMLGPLGNGLSVYDSYMGQCQNNIIVANTIDGPYGMNIRCSKNTFSFNNVCKTGRYGVYMLVDDNYSSQNSIISKDYAIKDDIDKNNAFFTAPYVTKAN